MDPDSTGRAGNTQPCWGWAGSGEAGTGAVPPARAGMCGLPGLRGLGAFGSPGNGIGGRDIPDPLPAAPWSHLHSRDQAGTGGVGFLQGLSEWPWDTSRCFFQECKVEALWFSMFPLDRGSFLCLCPTPVLGRDPGPLQPGFGMEDPGALPSLPLEQWEPPRAATTPAGKN